MSFKNQSIDHYAISAHVWMLDVFCLVYQIFAHNCYSHDLLRPTDILILPRSDVSDGGWWWEWEGFKKCWFEISVWHCDWEHYQLSSQWWELQPIVEFCQHQPWLEIERNSSPTLPTVFTTAQTVAFSHQIFPANDGLEQIEILTQLNTLYRDPNTQSQLSTND